MQSFLTALLDLAFPPHCPLCRRILAHNRALACPRCYAGLPWLSTADSLHSGDNFSHCVSAGWYQGDLREIIHAYKFEGQRQLSSALAFPLAEQVKQHYGGAFDLITWLPVSPKTLKSRGYDQSRLLAQALAEELGRTAVPLLQKPRHTPAQSSLSSPAARRQNVMGAFVLEDPAAASGQRVLLVDDVMTTGATLEEAAGVLRRAGAAQVMCAAFCRTPPAAKSPLGSG